ncbi:NADH:flavin oxidoreductase [Lutimonas zeaxanthinifaciens]|uniref:NADH:flavin oxidoreductase n=1 Tax=Lutimonas zeaxanthinifaciens TaxID=3060215 RepID=UPI00265D5B16|nr:NADH:flavin oxidoreductase [Lutimonas sp. YSD2104]WKK66053.1 NADH:flavin oxidoreductase [Lutimonas sp. YSD2104]
MSKENPSSISFETAFAPTKLGNSGLSLKSRFFKAATYEGMADHGIPNQKLIDHHVSMAKGGVGMTTVAYGAVSSDGRTFKDQMYINEASLKVLKELAVRVHDEGGRVSMQLTHCGYFTKNKTSKKVLAPSKIFNAYGFLSGLIYSEAMTLNDLDRVANDFETSARELQKIGFDAVEIHLGHGYLLSQFLSPLTNKRKDQYGGSIKNRSRYPLYVVDKVIKSVGPDFPVLVKLNLDDGIKGGFSLKDCIFVSKKLEEIGCAAIELSGGFTSKSPFYLLRGSVPLKGMIKNASSVAEKLTMALFGPLLVKKYRFKENFFLEKAIKVREEVNLDLIYLGGIDSKKGIEEVVSNGFNFIALARPLIHDPEFLHKLKQGEIDKSGCNRCNACIVEMDREGIKCVLN